MRVADVLEYEPRVGSGLELVDQRGGDPVAEELAVVGQCELVGCAEVDSFAQAEGTAQAHGDDVFALAAAEVRDIDAGERHGDGAFVDGVVAVEFDDGAEPFADVVVGVDVPGDGVGVAEGGLGVDGVEVVEGSSEV